MRQLAEKIAKTAQFWGSVTKVIHAGNPRPWTTLKCSISLKEMSSRRNSRDMFNDAVGKPPLLCKLRGSAGFRTMNRAEQF
jgi:hypothetical protein